MTRSTAAARCRTRIRRSDWTERRDAATNYIFVALGGDEVIGHAGLHGGRTSGASMPGRASAFATTGAAEVSTRLMETMIDLADHRSALRIS
jgi:hypothetical protein